MAAPKVSAKAAKRKSVDMDKFRQEIIENEKKKQMIYTPDLLERIKNTPALWDKHNPKYRLTNRNELWLKICEEIIPDFNHMKKSAKREFAQRLIKKWHNTRDSYRKSVRAKRPYVYSHLLTFLDPFMADVTLYSERNEEEENDEQLFLAQAIKCEEDEEEDDFVINTENFAVEGSQVIPTPAKVPKSAANDSDWDGSNTAPQNENLLPLITSMFERETDEDRSFFNSLIPSVKTLSQEAKLEFRLQVLNTLKTLTAKEKKSINVDDENENVDVDNDSTNDDNDPIQTENKKVSSHFENEKDLIDFENFIDSKK